MISKLDHPFRPVDISESAATFFSLLDLSNDMRKEQAYESDGRTAITLARSDDLTLVLTVLRSGSGMDEHKAPSCITVVVLQGRIKFSVSGHGETLLEESQSAVLSTGMPHSVIALEDSTVLIAIGGRSTA